MMSNGKGMPCRLVDKKSSQDEMCAWVGTSQAT